MSNARLTGLVGMVVGMAFAFGLQLPAEHRAVRLAMSWELVVSLVILGYYGRFTLRMLIGLVGSTAGGVLWAYHGLPAFAATWSEPICVLAGVAGMYLVFVLIYAVTRWVAGGEPEAVATPAPATPT